MRGRSIGAIMAVLMLVAVTSSWTPASTRPLPRVHGNARGYSALLMWHDVVPARKDVWFDVTASELALQLAEIKRRRLNVIPLEKMRDHLVSGAPIPPRSLVLTFDDNNLGLFRHAFPLLKRYRYPATIFVHTSYVGVRTGKDHCTWEQLAEMVGSGLVTVQSHTCTHPPDLGRLTDAALDRELVESRARIEKRLGKPVYAFAYTEGNYDRRVQEAVRRAGYTLAIGEDWGSAESSKSLLGLHRYSVHRRFAQALDDVERGAAR